MSTIYTECLIRRTDDEALELWKTFATISNFIVDSGKKIQ